MKDIYVVTWKYCDNSGFGVVRSFESEDRAGDLASLLRLHSSDKDFSVAVVKLEEG